MNRKKLFFVLPILVCVTVSGVFSLDLKLYGGAGNLAFDENRTSTLGAEDKDFGPHYFPLVLAEISGEQNGLAFSAGFEHDPLVRNRLFGNFRVDLEYAAIEAGPVIGVLNSGGLPFNPGVSAGIKLQLPGIIFAEGSGSSTLAFISTEKPGNYSQYSGAAALGFWVPYVICSLNMDVRNFALREKENFLIEDELYRYYFRADVFTKNVPYTLRVDLGYQSLTRSYTERKIDDGEIVNAAEADEFKSLFMGLEGSFTVNQSFKILLGAEIPFYSWSVSPMKNPPADTIFFQARAGVIWTLPSGKNN